MALQRLPRPPKPSPKGRSRWRCLAGSPFALRDPYPTTKAIAIPATPQAKAEVARFQSATALLGDPVAVTIVPLAVLVGVDDDFEKT